MRKLVFWVVMYVTCVLFAVGIIGGITYLNSRYLCVGVWRSDGMWINVTSIFYVSAMTLALFLCTVGTIGLTEVL